MKITSPGFYRTRDGRKAEVAAINPKAHGYSQLIGWINHGLYSWDMDGRHCPQEPDCADNLIAPWEEPKPKLKAWVNAIAKALGNE